MNDHVSLGYHRRGGPLSISEARREAIRTTLWLVPSVMVLMAILAFAFTYAVDRAIGEGSFQLPAFVTSGSPDAARQVLIAIAAAVITVAGVLFSITIIVLQLASQQFGPRMLRNFIRDLGTQFSLGAFVGTSCTRCSRSRRCRAPPPRSSSRTCRSPWRWSSPWPTLASSSTSSTTLPHPSS